MSRIGRSPIAVPAGVTIVIEGQTVRVSGPLGELSRTLPYPIRVRQEEAQILVERPTDSSTNRSLHGLSRTLVANMVTGVTTGFRRELELQGVGYRAALQGTDLQLSLGYSHPIRMTPAVGLKVEVPEPTRIAVSGTDKESVGQLAARIRSTRPPEPYKGKGVRYRGEIVRRKAGKSGKGAKG
ncbi:MAG TPA: 50S ribosomal protein L6 [Candidatus Nanopelagicaceae bacterium]|nr:50S ribosomal protein L6 [Candidatus Nanopelagicaceae bacterium]